jgi:TetR/AcrR family transcriptional regulator, mexCD-oprJ operon repressor
MTISIMGIVVKLRNTGSLLGVTKSESMRDRVAAGILDVAAAVIAEHGDAVSMGEVADTAGVGRATLYRYFPNREALLRALATTALEDLCERIESAELDTVSFEEGIARLARATATANQKYIALFRGGGKLVEPEEVDRRVREPIRRFFRRGAAEGQLRDDLPPELLMQTFIGLLDAALRMALPDRLGVEGTAAAITSIFLKGVLSRQAADQR